MDNYLLKKLFYTFNENTNSGHISKLKPDNFVI